MLWYNKRMFIHYAVLLEKKNVLKEILNFTSRKKLLHTFELENLSDQIWGRPLA